MAQRPDIIDAEFEVVEDPRRVPGPRRSEPFFAHGGAVRLVLLVLAYLFAMKVAGFLYGVLAPLAARLL